MNPTDAIIELVVPGYVGETTRLKVHRGVLCKSSKFFQNAVKPEWTHQEERVINLPEDLADTVINYVKWLYCDKLAISQILPPDALTPEKKAEEKDKIYVLLAQAYVFGEKMMDLKYKNVVMKVIYGLVGVFRKSMGSESVRILYDGTPSGSPLRRFIAENIAHKAWDDSEKGAGWMRFFEECPKEALTDGMRAMVKVRPIKADSLSGVYSYLEEE
ncbi:hypothetical protein J4E89_002979 [Alternaria sp. Ai002NY15]|nr:hypothetical protein J4E89_002979 [Alternaria sp. Ai002NY15]